MTAHRYQQIRFVSLFGGLKNALLTVLKITFGTLGHSQALVADGIHSLSDLLIDLVVILAAKFGSKVADEDHPYGHGRIETAATVFLAFILAFAGVGILIDAGRAIMASKTNPIPSEYVLWIVVISIIVNEGLYYWTRHIAKQIKSKLLMTNAWHHRSDSTTSFAVAFGVLGTWLGLPQLDVLAAIVVGLMILKVAWNFGWQNIQELVDRVPNVEKTKKIKQLIKKVPGVIAIHQLRTRSIGGSILCDVHVLVNPDLSVSEGHHIGQEVEQLLMLTFPEITDVTVHIDSEDDEITSPSRHLPNRSQLYPALLQKWEHIIPGNSIRNATFHYQNGGILIELVLPLRFSNQPFLLEELKKISHSEKFITDIRLLYYKSDE